MFLERKVKIFTVEDKKTKSRVQRNDSDYPKLVINILYLTLICIYMLI